MKLPKSVADYRRMAAYLIAKHPRDKAMELMVGGGIGDYDNVGKAEADLLEEIGLAPGQLVIDLGCGSGRLSTQLAKRYGPEIKYVGIDVVPELIAFARERAEPSYDFHLTDGTHIPATDASADIVLAFSVMTHLRTKDAKRYIREAHRALKYGGLLVFSFLESREGKLAYFKRKIVERVERAAVETHFQSAKIVTSWADQFGFAVQSIIPPDRIGQNVAVLQKKPT